MCVLYVFACMCVVCMCVFVCFCVKRTGCRQGTRRAAKETSLQRRKGVCVCVCGLNHVLCVCTCVACVDGRGRPSSRADGG